MMEHVAVVGCGLMGTGIVEAIASAGIPVKAIKATPGDTSRVQKALERSLSRRVAKGKLSQTEADAILARIEVTTDLAAIHDCDLVIESAIEEIEPKSELLRSLERSMTPGAILATNTSSLSLDSLANRLERPAQFLAIHFFNPAQVMKLVELGITERTAPGVVEAARRFCTDIGKNPIEVAASPGYVVNRLLVPYLLQAIETLETGIASAEAIDEAMKLGCGHPMGPLALSDLIGLDVVLAMAKTLNVELQDPRYRAPSLLRRLVLRGELGRKTGVGIFDYRGEQPVENPALVLPISIAPGFVEAAE